MLFYKEKYLQKKNNSNKVLLKLKNNCKMQVIQIRTSSKKKHI